jgi:hypothetical protein
MVDINGKYVLKKAVYSPDEYSKIKRHFNTIVKRFNDDIVLKSTFDPGEVQAKH